jgi:hypothetical protein
MHHKEGASKQSKKDTKRTLDDITKRGRTNKARKMPKELLMASQRGGEQTKQ